MAWNDPLRDDQWSRLRWLLREWSGMECPDNRKSDLREATAKAARFAGVDEIETLLRRLAEPSETVLRSVWISAYTIHETYFFRDAPQWRAIRHRALPERIQARRDTRSIKVWSAGCSSGEEAYTAAISLHELLPDPSWTIRILGTDISSDVLEKARKGIYREWSFRQTPLHIREDNFECVAGSSWRIRPDIARPVRFELLNLKTGEYPETARGIEDFDLILCRNVLIYFAREEMESVIARLTDCLAPGGYLALGPAEPFPSTHLPLEPIVSDGATLYRKRAAEVAASRPSTALPEATQRRPLPAIPATSSETGKTAGLPRSNIDSRPFVRPFASEVPNSNVPKAPVQTSERSRPVKPSTPGPDVAMAGEFARKAHDAADGGRWDEALAASESAIAADPLHAGSFYIKALALKELGRLDDSRDALRRCLFIQKQHWMGHLLAAGLWQREGNPARARSHLNAILTGLEALDPAEILPDTGGINVGRMRALAESQLKHLDGLN
ncbi:hypothetical protein GC170_11845 [bacterium]|nr:hypothetical protein [bacterium]